MTLVGCMCCPEYTPRTIKELHTTPLCLIPRTVHRLMHTDALYNNQTEEKNVKDACVPWTLKLCIYFLIFVHMYCMCIQTTCMQSNGPLSIQSLRTPPHPQILSFVSLHSLPSLVQSQAQYEAQLPGSTKHNVKLNVTVLTFHN